MADIQDLEDTGEIGELEAVEQGIAQKPEKQESDDDLDPRYRGKSAKEIAKMHQEAEKLIARQSQEVGEVRRLADELIKSQLKPKSEEEKPQVDFFENPEEAVRRAVESNPEVKQAKEYAQFARMEAAKQKLNQLHPDSSDIVKSEDFLNFVKAKKTRMELFQRADNYDVDAADDLLTTFKELKQSKVSQISDVEKAAREKTLKNVSVETGGSGESSKKIYRRADLIQLKLKDPQAFAARQDEIDAAYREGRVR